MPKIRNITISNFRGIRETNLDLSGRSLVILGENGTGKSSFIDGLEFYFSGVVSHLEGSQRVSTNRHAPHVLSGSGQTFVTIEFDRLDSPCTRNLRGFQNEPTDLKNFHIQGKNARFILRRKNLLDFILAQPGPRYEQLAAIIGVADLDKTERALLQMRDQLQSEVENLDAQLNNEKGKLQSLLNLSDYSDGAILSGVNTRLESLSEEKLQILDEAESRKLAAVALSRSPEDTQQAVQVQNIKNSASKLSETISFIGDYQPLWTNIAALQSNSAHIRELLFQEVLTSSQRLFKDYVDINHCPVCQQPINREELMLAIEQRLEKAEVIAESAAAISKFRDQLDNAIRLRLEDLKELATGISSYPELEPKKNEISAYKDYLENLDALLKSEPVDLQLGSLDDLQTSPIVKDFGNYLVQLMEKLQSEQVRLAPTDQDRQTLTIIDLLTLATTSRKSLRELEPKMTAKRATLREMNEIYETFLSTKRNKIRQIYNEIPDTAGVCG